MRETLLKYDTILSFCRVVFLKSETPAITEWVNEMQDVVLAEGNILKVEACLSESSHR